MRIHINHRNPRPGLERTFTLRTVTPLASAGFKVYFTNRWPGMAARYHLRRCCRAACRGDSRPLRRAGGRAGLQHRRIVGPSADRGPTRCGAQGGRGERCVHARPGGQAWAAGDCCMPSRRPVATRQRPSWTGCEGKHPFPLGSYPAHTVRDGGRQAHHDRESDGRDRHAAR